MAANCAGNHGFFRSFSGDPGGIRTRDLNLERVASWARLDDGVSGHQYTYALLAAGGWRPRIPNARTALAINQGA